MQETKAAIKFSMKKEGDDIVVETNIDSASIHKQTIKPPIPDLKLWQHQARNLILYPNPLEKNPEQTKNIFKNFGNALFNQNEEVRSIIKHKLRSAHSNSTIAFEIIFLDRATAAYPWEACAFAWEELGIEREGKNIIVVRTPKTPQLQWKMFESIKILVAGSSPDDSAPNNIPKEYSAIQRALNSFLYRELYNLPAPIQELTIHKLGVEAKIFQPNVVHLITHGGPNTLEFETPEGHRTPVSPGELTQALNEAQPNLLLFVSTACLAMQDTAEPGSWGLGEALSLNVPLSIGMQLPVKSQHAIDFSSEFYTVLARSKSVVDAFVSARNKLSKNEPFSPIALAPVFYRGIPDYGDAQLFTYRDMPQFIEERVKALWSQIDALRDDARNSAALIEAKRIINEVDKNIIDSRLDQQPFPFTTKQKGYFRKMGEATAIAREKASRMQRLIEAQDLEYELQYLDSDSKILIENLRYIGEGLKDLLGTFSDIGPSP